MAFETHCPICNKPMAEHEELGATLHKLVFVLRMEDKEDATIRSSDEAEDGEVRIP